jgi:putative ABC transport system permease protein
MRAWLRRFRRGNRVRDDIREELRFHLDRLTDENIARGMTPENAARSARRQFGAVQQLAEDGYDVWDGGVDSVLGDLRHGARMLRKDPVFTCVAALVLALGIGAGTAIFSVVRTLVLQPLPYPDPGQIVLVDQLRSKADMSRMWFSVAEIDEYRRLSHAFSALVEYSGDQYVLRAEGAGERVQAGVVSHDFFDMLGVRTSTGRGFAPSDERPGAPPTLLLTREYWLRRYAADPSVVGRVLTLNATPFVVIGVLPAFPQYPDQNDVYMTTSSSAFRMWPERLRNHGRRFAIVFGRMKPGVSLAAANADLARAAATIQQAHPEFYPPEWGYRATATRLETELTGRARSTVLLLGAAAFCILLIACANVINLSLARLAYRRQELTLRLALGASRGRIFRQLVVESLLRSMLAAAVGVAMAAMSTGLLAVFLSRFTSRAQDIRLDVPALVFACAIAIVISVVSGSVLMLSWREELAQLMQSNRRNSAPRHGRLRDGLVVAQVACTIALLCGTALLVRSFLHLRDARSGVTADHVLTVHLDFSATRYPTPMTQRAAANGMLRKIATIPGVAASAVATSFPLDPDAVAFGLKGLWNRFQLETERPGQLYPWAPIRVVSPAYFDALGIPIVRGRAFADGDTLTSPPVAIVNQSFVRHRLGRRDPIGVRMSADGKTWLTICGVAAQTREMDLTDTATDEVYYPLAQLPSSPSGDWVRSVIVRTAGDPGTVSAAVRDAIASAAPDVAQSFMTSADAARRDALVSPRVTTILLGAFALIALVVSLSGIAGMLALTVAQRTRELGIRLALGAPRSAIVRNVVAKGMRLVAVGLAAGFGVAAIVIRALRGLLFEVSAVDPLALAAAVTVLIAAALLACYLPARGVARIDPLLSLRQD